jgi:hypothetical protein
MTIRNREDSVPGDCRADLLVKTDLLPVGEFQLAANASQLSQFSPLLPKLSAAYRLSALFAFHLHQWLLVFRF